MEPLKIVAVCTGNICRSPLSEYFLKNALNPEYFSISSAGTRAVRGGEVPERQRKIARKLGLDAIVEHKPRQITATDIRDADLILTATLRHRRRIVRTLPVASSRVFTMREYAHLAPHVKETDLIDLIAQGIPPLTIAAVSVHQLRGTVPQPARDEDYDIVDPFGEDKKTYRMSAEQLVTAHHSIVEFLQRIEQLTTTLNTRQGMTLPTSAPTEATTFPPTPLRNQDSSSLPSPAPAPPAPAPTPPPSQAVDPPTPSGTANTPQKSRSTLHPTPRPSTTLPGHLDHEDGPRPKATTNTFEFPSFPIDGPPTLGKGIQLGLDSTASSRQPGKHTFNPKNPDHAKGRSGIMFTSRDLPVSKADRGKHRRYSK